MKQAVLYLQQIRRWSKPDNWMVNGYSQNNDLLYLWETERYVRPSAGGFSLSAASLLGLRFVDSVLEEGLFSIELDANTIHRGLWTPKLMETVTESFFWQDDLLILNYRLLKVLES